VNVKPIFTEHPRPMPNMRAWHAVKRGHSFVILLSLWAPRITAEEAADLTTAAITKPLRWRADWLGARLNLHEAERAQITTIGAVDLTKAQRKARRRQRDQLLKAAERRRPGAKPGAEYEATSLSRTKPWERLGMSRRA
jgi:hypothetical protein